MLLSLVSFLFYSAKELVPSLWSGNYTCSDDGVTVDITMNITKSSTIATDATATFLGSSVLMTGSFATILQTLTLQSINTFLRSTTLRNYSAVEVNAVLQNVAYMSGYTVFKEGNKTAICPMDLYRLSGKIPFINRSSYQPSCTL